MQRAGAPTFQSSEVATYWRYIASSLDRLMGVLEGQPPEVLNWRPPAPDTNSMFVLARHTLSNARVNLLGSLCGQSIDRDREGEFGVVAEETGASAIAWPEHRAELERALSLVSNDALDAAHVHHWRGTIMGRELLIVVARHAAEHLGQAELTRDLAVAALTTEREETDRDD